MAGKTLSQVASLLRKLSHTKQQIKQCTKHSDLHSVEWDSEKNIG